MDPEELRKFLESSLGEDFVKKVENESKDEKDKSKKDLSDKISQFLNFLPPENREMLQGLLSAVQNPKKDSGNTVFDLDILKKVAHSKISKESNAAISASDYDKYHKAFTNASLWLDSIIDLPAIDVHNQDNVLILRPIDFVDLTLDKWVKIATPIAKNISSIIKEDFTEKLGDIGENSQNPMLGLNVEGMHTVFDLGEGTSMSDLVSSMGRSSYSTQIGSSIGEIANSVISGTEFSFPVTEGKVSVIPFNLVKASVEFDVDIDDLVQYFAIREVAASRLFASCAWLRGHILSIVNAYGDGLKSNVSDLQADLQEELSGMDLEDPKAIMGMVGNHSFGLQGMGAKATPEQKVQIKKLEAIISLIEGWIDYVSFRSGAAYIGSIGKISENLNRFRITNSPYQKLYNDLLGMNINVNKFKEVSALWGHLYLEKGSLETEKIWTHPDNVSALFKKYKEIFGEVKDDNIEVKHDWDSLLD